jgi:hypothetical protein
VQIAFDFRDGLRCGDAIAPCLLPVTDVLKLKKNSLGRSAVVFCASEIIKLFSVQFYVDRAVHKCNFRIVINKKKLRDTVIIMFVTGSVCTPPNAVASVKGLYPSCAGQLHCLE